MEGKTNYEILTPNNMVENKAEDALKFALENEQVKNIAITGQYSSGKSSIIQSYFSKYVDKKDYLNISLATFEKKENEATPIEESNSLEKVIIEKLYYSILNKYDLQRDIISSLITIVLVAFINVGIYLFNMESINNSLTNNFWITLIFMGLEIICLTGLIGYSISYVINLQKIKLKFGDVEVEVNQTGNNQEKNRNLLNEEIEFIVKTMNIAKYKYIIFEDLDRFQNPQIFERLRDLNITLNATLKEKVKFLYAIKDEMFIADNRTKFFDFIIPIVPYVSYENSGEELLKIIKKHQLDTELSEDFILDISLYVSDIRILKNTVNEYIVYKKSLDKKIYDCEKLFSILLYKNTCSEDFAKLQRKQGEIYNCFLKKNEKINEYIEKNKEKIEEKNNEYSEIEKNLISKNQFEKLAIYMIKSGVNNDNTVTLENEKGQTITIKYKMDTENILEKFIFSEGTIIEYVYAGSWKREKLIDFYKSKCPEFLQQYEDFKNGIDEVKEKINIELEEIKKEIDKAKEYPLRELLQTDKEVVKLNLGDYSDLIRYLLSNGYIDEDYNIYINKFHEGSITERDYDFIMAVKNGKEQDYNVRLDNSIKIAKRLKIMDLKKEEVLNIDLLNTLIENEDFAEKKKTFLCTLIKSNRYIYFIKDYICNNVECNNKKELIKCLCELDKNLLKNVKEAKIEQKYKNIIFENIIICMEVKKLKQLNNIDEIIKYVEENNLLKDQKLNDIKSKIIEFNFKYYNTAEFRDNSELYNYIIENNRYQINYDNIFDILLNSKKDNKNGIEEKNYEQIATNIKLKSYIDSKIQLYIDNVYSKLSKKQNNSINLIKELLNNPLIKLEEKQIIIEKEVNPIDNISEIEDSSLWKDIFNNNLVEIKWDNINVYYDEFGIDLTLIKLFNDKEKNICLLSNDTIIEEESSTEFVKDLLVSNELDEDTYSLILNKSKYKLDDVEINNLRKDRLLKLINNKRIVFESKMIENIRNYSTEMFIAFIKNNYSNMHKEIDNKNIIFTLEEIEEILKSDLTTAIKSKSLDMINDERIEEVTKELSQKIGMFVIENNLKEKLNATLLLKVISDIQNIDMKLKLLNLNFKVLNKDNIEEYLCKLGENYSKIIIDRTRPRFEDSESIKLLLENIKNLGYNIKYNLENDEIVLTNTIR